MFDKKEFKKVEMPTVVKLEKKGDSVSGEYIAIEPSKEYKDSYALTFKVNDKVNVLFIPSFAEKLFMAQDVKKNDLFILELTGKQKNKEGTFEYNTYDLYVKRGQ